MLRIAAGEYRSRRLLSPSDAALSRPCPQRLKESIFDRLRGHMEGAVVVDLFAGVGTLGLEAASRGARRVVMVERQRRIHALLLRNIERLGCGERCRALMADATSPAMLPRLPSPVDLVLVDPPYDLMKSEHGRSTLLVQAGRIGELLAEDGFMVLRTPHSPEDVPHAIDGLQGPEPHRHARGMWVLYYARTAEGGARDD